MAVDHMSIVIDRLQHDQQFKVAYCANPDTALSRYQLSTAEVRALKTGDGLQLELMGLGCEWDEFVQTLCGGHPGD